MIAMLVIGNKSFAANNIFVYSMNIDINVYQ